MTPWAFRLSVTAPKGLPGGRITRADCAEDPQARMLRAERMETAASAERLARLDGRPRGNLLTYQLLPPGPPRFVERRGNAAATRTRPAHPPRPSVLGCFLPAPGLHPTRGQCSSVHPTARPAGRCGWRWRSRRPARRQHLLLHCLRVSGEDRRRNPPVSEWKPAPGNDSWGIACRRGVPTYPMDWPEFGSRR